MFEKKDRGLRGPEVTWFGRENRGGSAGSESKVQIRHCGEVGSDKEDAMLEKK